MRAVRTAVKLCQLCEVFLEVFRAFLQGWNPAKGLPGGGILECAFCGPLGTLKRNHHSIALVALEAQIYSHLYWMWLFHEQYVLTVLISQRHLNSWSQGAWWQFAVVVLDERHQKRRCPAMTTFESQKCYLSSLNYLWTVNFSCFLGTSGCTPICSHFSYCCFCMSLLSSLAWGQKGRSTGWWEIVHLHLWFWFEETDGFLKVCRDLCTWYFYFASVGCQCKTSIELGCSFCFCAAEQSTSKVQAVFVAVVTFSLPPVDAVASQRALAGGLWCTGCKEIRQWRGQCDTFSMSGHDSLHDVMLYFSALFFLACISYVYSSPHRFVDI